MNTDNRRMVLSAMQLLVASPNSIQRNSMIHHSAA